VRRPLRGDPILWKERQVEGLAPLNFLRRVPRWLGVVAVFALSTASSLAILADCLPMGTTPAMVWEMLLALDLDGLARVAAGMAPSSGRFYTQGTVVVFVGSLLVGIRCSGAITGERERQTWEALLMTPLTTHQLVRNKLWGILGAALPYFVAYAVPALALSALGGPAALIATALSVAIALLALLYVAGAGLWCTSRALTSWRSLLGTLGFTYVGGFVLVLATAFLAIFVWIFIIMAMAILDALLQRLGVSTSLVRGAAGVSFDAYRVAFCIVLAAFFLGLSVFLIKTAETPVANRERARHWKPRPRWRRRRERW
jgi:hypothetical protein